MNKGNHSGLRRLWLLIPMIAILAAFTGCTGVILPAIRVFTQAEKSAASKPTPPADPDVHNAGMYKVGVDIAAGLYYVAADQMGTGYAEVDSDSTGSLDSMISLIDLETFTFVSVQDGQYLKVSGGYFMPASKVPAIQPVNGKYGPGTYRVGQDLPAGEYQLTADDRKAGYYEASTDCSGATDSIISNDFFSTQSYVTVKDGEYLQLQRCYIATK